MSLFLFKFEVTMPVVYQHLNPKTKEVFYIGIGLHERRAYSFYKSHRSGFWAKYVAKHGEPIVEVISRPNTYEEAKELEIALIKKHGKRADGTGVLVNLADGGDGSPGVKPSKETIEKRSATVRGSKRTLETKLRMSKAHKGKVMTEQHKLNISKAKSGENGSKARKVLDTNTGVVFGCAKYAAEFYGLRHRGLCAKLAGERTNNTPFRYIS